MASQKLPPFDEFTVFGLSSNAGQVETVGVKDCMKFEEEPKPMPSHMIYPPKRVVNEIGELEGKLTMNFVPPTRRDEFITNRPVTARLSQPPRAGVRALRRALEGEQVACMALTCMHHVWAKSSKDVSLGRSGSFFVALLSAAMDF